MCGAVGPQELRNTTLTSTLHAKSFCSLRMETDIFTLLQFNQPSFPYCLPGIGGLAKHAAADLIWTCYCQYIHRQSAVSKLDMLLLYI